MRKITPLLVLGALCMPMAVAAQNDSADPSQTQAAEAPDANKDKKVCKSLKITGSRLARKRICATQAEWDRQREEAIKLGSEIADNPDSTVKPGGQ